MRAIRRNARRIAVAVAVMAVCLTWGAGPASASSVKVEPSADASIAGLNLTLGCLNPSGSMLITPTGGSTGYLKAKGHTQVVANYVPFGYVSMVKFVNNSGRVEWTGASPWNANSVTLNEYWDIDYTAISWTYSGAPSGTISRGSGKIEYEKTVANTWVVDHAWNEVRLSIVLPGTIQDAEFDVTGDFQFGGGFLRTVTAYSNHSTRMDATGIPARWGGC